MNQKHPSTDSTLRLALAIIIVGFTIVLGALSLFHAAAFPVFSAMLTPMGIVLGYYFLRKERQQ